MHRRHPWVFSGAVDRVDGQADPGDIVDLLSAEGQWMARAFYNPRSQIRCRILSWREDEKIDADFWLARLRGAILARSHLQLEPHTTAYRLVNAEADDLPGLIIDRYEETIVFQVLTVGIERRKEMLVNMLADLLRPAGIYERSDAQVRRREGMPMLASVAWGEEPQPKLIVQENGHRYRVLVTTGHKTGLYLDQRDNRALVCQERFVSGKEILNVFAYTGGFAVYAAAAGAKSITNVDISPDLLALAKENMRLNGYRRHEDEYLAGDAFQILRHFRDQGRTFDVIILDPPKFARRQSEVMAACRGYKDLNWLSMRLLRQNGLLSTFSCSGAVNAELFQKVVFGAALDAGRQTQILFRLDQAPDHPVLLTFPESAYLKGLLCRVL